MALIYSHCVAPLYSSGTRVGRQPQRLRLLFFFQAEDGIRDIGVTGVQTCALPIYLDTQTVKGADEIVYVIQRCQRTDSLFHFLRSLIGEGDAKDIRGVYSDFFHKVGETMAQNLSLAGACPGNNSDSSVKAFFSLYLLII